MPVCQNYLIKILIKFFLSFLITAAIFLSQSNKLCLFWPKKVFAASINLSNAPSQLLGPDAEYPVDIVLSINVSDGTIYYLRGVFYKPGTSKYCGYTWNGSTWFSGPYSTDEGWKNFLEISIQSSSWSGQLKAKLDPEDTDCRESGTYNFKVQRFTQNGSASFDPQNELQVEVVIPTPTPEPKETPEPTLTPNPVLTPASTLPPTPTKKPISTPTSAKKPTPTPPITPVPTLTGEILGEEATVSTESPSSTPEVLGETSRNSLNLLPKILIGVGILLLLISGGFLLLPKIKDYNVKKDEQIPPLG